MDDLSSTIERAMLDDLRAALVERGVPAEVRADAGMRTDYWHRWGVVVPASRSLVHVKPDGMYEWFDGLALRLWPVHPVDKAAADLAALLS